MMSRVFLSLLVPLLCGLHACGPTLPQLPPAQTNGSSVPENADAATFARMGDRLMQQGDLQSAARMYNRAISIDSNDATLYARMGDVAWRRGEFNAAANLYGQALRIDQSNPDALLGRARALALADETDAAMLLVNDLINTHGPEYRSLGLKAMLFDLDGDHDSARTLFQSALEQRPEDANLKVSLAYSHALARDYRSAVETLRPLGQNQATAGAGQYALADIYALSGQTDVGVELRKAAAGTDEINGADRVFLTRLAGLTGRQQARALYFRTLPTLEQSQTRSKAQPPTDEPDPGPTPPELPTADYWVQIASFKSFEALELGWYNIRREHPELSARLMPRVESLDIKSKGRFHRLYAGGYATEDAAKKTCNALRAAALSCVIVVGERTVRPLAELQAER